MQPFCTYHIAGSKLHWYQLHWLPSFIPSICIVSSSRPDILLRSNISTRSTTPSMRLCVARVTECGPVGSYEDNELANWICIEPMRLEASFGQNRGEV